MRINRFLPSCRQLLRAVAISLALASGTGAGIGMHAAQARTLDEVRASGKLIVATEVADLPFNYFQGAKQTGSEVGLAEVMVDGTYEAISQKYLQEDVGCK